MSAPSMKFGYRISDNSLAPKILAGENVLIDVDVEPKPGNFVLTKIAGDFNVRQFSESDDLAQIIGVVTHRLPIPTNLL